MPKNLDLESGAVEEGGSVEKRRTPIASDGLERLKTSTVDHMSWSKKSFYFQATDRLLCQWLLHPFKEKERYQVT